jgi:signal peptidase I
MRTFFQKRVVIVALVACVVAIIILFSGFSLKEMGSTSMQPLIMGKGEPPSHAGDLIVIAKWFRIASLRTGDLVIVDIPTPTGCVHTVRRIEQQPDTPTGQFYLRAESDNGIDSRQFGPLPASDIHGRVIWILRRY